jgi:hypothetical protein
MLYSTLNIYTIRDARACPIKASREIKKQVRFHAKARSREENTFKTLGAQFTLQRVILRIISSLNNGVNQI